MTSAANDATSVAELQQQLANARLCADEARIEAKQLQLDNSRSVTTVAIRNAIRNSQRTRQTVQTWRSIMYSYQRVT